MFQLHTEIICEPVCRFHFLPSATKLRRLCFYRHLSVHRGVGVPGPGGCLLRGVSAPRGCLLPGGVSAPRGCLLLGGVSAPGGQCLLLGGVCSQGVSHHALRQTPPPRERRLLLRTVRVLLECILVYSLVSRFSQLKRISIVFEFYLILPNQQHFYFQGAVEPHSKRPLVQDCYWIDLLSSREHCAVENKLTSSSQVLVLNTCNICIKLYLFSSESPH